MRIGSLFSGIGGLELGLERAGVGETVWQVEKDPYCRKVLAKHWPDATRYEDVTEVDWSTVEPVEVICGGFPCQPFSVAGRQKGLSDERWMWPAFADAIRVLRPRFVVVENVPALLRDADAFGIVLADLAACGFDAEWDCIPAAAVGAPHLRDRVYLIAYAQRLKLRVEPVPEPWSLSPSVVADDGDTRTVADTDGARLEGQDQRRPQFPIPAGRGGTMADSDSAAGCPKGTPGEAVPRPREIERPGRRCGGERHCWATEPDVGRVAHGVPSRVDRLRALGNAVVPQVAEVIGRRILELL